MPKPEYKIHIEDENIVTVLVLGNEYVKAFYFGTDGDAEGTAQELYDLLKTAGVEAERVMDDL
jgi:DNA topoisomerase IA